MAEHLSNLLADGGVAVITRGAGPTIVARKGLETFEVPVPPVHEEEIVDTNGCGDAFVGGFLALAVRGVDVDRCVDEGHRCAGVILRRRGCTLDTERDASEG